MDPLSGARPRGRGRGRQSLDANIDDDACSVSSFGSSASTLTQGASIRSESSIGRGRGRRGLTQIDPSDDPSPVTLPDNPEEDDFLAAFRRLQQTGALGRGRGKGFPFSRCPSDSGDSGVASASRSGITSSRSGLRLESSFAAPSFRSRAPSVTTSSNIGIEDYIELERETVIRRGEKGKRVAIIANFLRLSIAKEMGLYEYHVDFEPTVDSFRIRKLIIRELSETLGNARTFDGAKLYLATMLQNKMSQFSTVNPVNKIDPVAVTIKFVKKNSLSECVHFYNVLFRRIMEQLGMVEMKRHYFNHRAVYGLPQHRLEIWPGYVTAIDEYEGGLMICCDSSFRVLRTASILDIGYDFQIDQNPIVDNRKKFLDYILGKIVLTKYNNRHYRVDDIDWDRNPRSKFTNSKGHELSFVEYYKTAYDIDIHDMTQPLLIHRPKPNQHVGPVPLICLIPELCFVTGMDSDITSNYTIMKDVAKFTRLTPQKRSLALKQFVENVNGCPEAVSMLSEWGLKLEDAAVKLEGRVLTIPRISLNSNPRDDFHPDTSNFGNSVMNKPIFDPVPVRNWLLLFTRNDYEKARRMTDMYRQVSRPFGIAFSCSESHAINVGSGTVNDFRKAILQNLDPQIQFVVAILPRNRDDLYIMIKKLCTIEKPIPSQVILSKTLSNDAKMRSIMQKIVLQINCKLGGSLWTIRIPLPEKIMLIGMDVYHDPARKSQSVTAVVGSLNESFTKYYSRVIFQPRHQETVNSMLPIIMDMMRAFADENNGYPDRVIVWRDGVSDGQLEFTKEHEVSQIHESFRQFSISPKFTFCVVQKRINARLFLNEGKFNTLDVSNPEPGTVVDHTITRKYLYDFFLISQLVREGTVTPTHFVVLEDTAEVPPDLIQKFAFATSFLYYNWTGSIRVPAMCQYAHKLAGLVGQYLRAEPSLELAKNLYYL